MYLAGIIIVICRTNVAQMKAPGYIIGFQFLADQSFIKTTMEKIVFSSAMDIWNEA
jgi:hypothetical protein